MKQIFTLLLIIFSGFHVSAQQHKYPHVVPKKVIPKGKPSAASQRKTNHSNPSHFVKAEDPVNFNGQWKGGFSDNTAGLIGILNDRIDYVLELETHGTEVTGYSYTYFSEGNKRYYTICKLKGTLNKLTNEVEVTEFERTKYNTPPDFSNCFQTHRLKYIKQNKDSELLKGSWIPAPNQQGNCGYGQTTLVRRIVNKTPDIVTAFSPEIKNKPQYRDLNREKPAHADKKPNPKTQSKIPPPVIKNNVVKKYTTPKKDTASKKDIAVKPAVIAHEKILTPTIKFETRSNTVLKNIEIKNETFTVDFYDNGEIDGDSISVFYNGKLVLQHQRLSDRPITVTLTVDPSRAVNEVVMYAENLGTIPPNTALMIVHDGDDRYEARIVSDTEKNGTIRLTYKPR
ncbi:MAG: hypothetical protein H0W12_10345 [Chitinophagaceae bacterium]|nr:hypothetical protein [Chitinophagaceae bacterium]